MIFLMSTFLGLNSQEGPPKEKKKEAPVKQDTVVVSERKADTIAVKQLKTQEKLKKLKEKK